MRKSSVLTVEPLGRPNLPLARLVSSMPRLEAARLIFLAIQDASKKWTMPIRNWRQALNRFMIMFEDRLSDYI